MEAAPATRVLLVEDELTDALAVKRSLQHRGRSRQRFALECAATLEQGIEHLSRSAVDVLLVDLRLPDSDGTGTVARLRERDPHVPLVVFTGDDDPRAAARAFEEGADEYLVKHDLHGRLLRRTLRHAIERRRRCATAGPSAPSEPSDDGRRGLLHDLKSLQTSILGNARILQREMRGGGFLAQRVEALLVAARNAADLIRRIDDADEAHEFACPVELSAFVCAVQPLARAVVPEHVELRVDPAPSLVRVSVSPEAMRRVVLELVANAVDAIGEAAGCVEIRTGEAVVADHEIRELVAPGGMAPGPHAWLEVRDDGRGLDGETRARVFERGFSTEGAGRGHGLWHLRSILARHRAGLRVRSESGSGAAFRILLPTRG